MMINMILNGNVEFMLVETDGTKKHKDSGKYFRPLCILRSTMVRVITSDEKKYYYII